MTFLLSRSTSTDTSVAATFGVRYMLRRVGAHWWPAALFGVLLFGCDSRPDPGTPKQTTVEFEHDGTHVAVEFSGEATSTEVFGDAPALPVQPLAEDGRFEGILLRQSPSWLRFTYRIGADQRTILIAKRPLMNHVSWDAIARAGAVGGTDDSVVISNVPYAQNATVRAADGNEYLVRLPRCGQSTMAQLSEWNLLIGGVHVGDPDFTGDSYGWLVEPYTDEDLKVGIGGFLSWCEDSWSVVPGYRVLRGYFHVSRFHAAPSATRTDRVVWRPVLELIEPGEADERWSAGNPLSGGETSPHRDVRYFGTIGHEELFRSDWRITDGVPVAMGAYIGDGRPNWLHFESEGRTLLVAAVPVKHSLSWNAIAEAGAALGDGSVARLGGTGHVQRAEVSDVHGNRYRVRLLTCGGSTMDPRSEWNRLIGGIHVGDGDFVAKSDGRYGWIERVLTDTELHVGELEGAATWCQERKMVGGREYATNRGYLTVSRFHLTEAGFRGYGFGWRPVLERID